MNKLVSKNPVQRFKEGKKIVKAQFGRNLKWDWEDTIKRKGDGTFIFNSPVNNQLFNSEFFKNNPQIIKRIQKPIRNTVKNTTTPIDNYYVKGYEGRKDEISKLGGVRAIQKMLGFTGKNLDGKWGENTELAYQNYLKSKQQQQAPELPSTTDLVQHITSQINFNQPNKSSAPFIYNQLQSAKEQAEKSSNNQYISQEIPEQFLAMLMGKRYYKQGGQLVSRNPIQRFKLKK